MAEFLTTRELAALLRVKERKIYDLVSAGSLPVRRVTGKLLFPRKDIEEWIAGPDGQGGEEEALHAPAAAGEAGHLPLIVAGGHDPLLEWALRESRSGIAVFLDGALDGLERAARGECTAVGLHIPEKDGWNVGTVEGRFSREPWVLLEWARRVRGLMFRRDLPRPPKRLSDARGLRFQARQPEAGSELVLDMLLAQEKLKRSDLSPVESVERSETDLALAIAGGRADVGLGIEAAARQHQLGFLPLVEERFDLLVWRKAYFDPPFQKLVAFCREPAFQARAADLGGYDVTGFGTVRYNGC
ncbi:helix-turn-helix transcriptional regulator [Xanthobacter autotrophicus DSM 431]|uniref:substrate-binding domain-containing protein n=1 Tax=Xanthobacter nonsaccharivorans TaxID=3119912 RepID=UPI003729976F